MHVLGVSYPFVPLRVKRWLLLMLDACALQAVTVAHCGCVHDVLLVPAVLQVSLLHRGIDKIR
jgi:hypothetical protein